MLTTFMFKKSLRLLLAPLVHKVAALGGGGRNMVSFGSNLSLVVQKQPCK